MNKQSPALRVFVFALLGVALGIAISRLSSGAMVTALAILCGIGVFVLLRLRSGR